MRVVARLYRSRADGVVDEGFGGQVIGGAVHVRNGGRGHRMLVRRRIIVERVGGEFGHARVLLDRKVRSVSASGRGFLISHGYRYPVISRFGRKEFRASGRVAEAVGIVFPLVEDDLLPRVRDEILIRERTADRYRGLECGRGFRIQRRQIGDDLVPFSRRKRRTRRRGLHGDDVRQCGEGHRNDGDGGSENRSCDGRTSDGL